MVDTRTWRILETEDDVTPEMEKEIEECLDYFHDRRTLPTEEFIDTFCKGWGGSGYSPTDWDLDSYINPAAKKIMRIARRLKREEDA